MVYTVTVNFKIPMLVMSAFVRFLKDTIKILLILKYNTSPTDILSTAVALSRTKRSKAWISDVINTQHDDEDDYDNFYGAKTQHMLLQGRLDKDHDTCQRYALSK